MNAQKQIDKLLDGINERIDNIEDLMAWMIRANQRFNNGQRVQFSRKADRSGFSSRRKNGVRRGTVIDADDSVIVTVLLDGYRRPMAAHHQFFDPIGRK